MKKIAILVSGGGTNLQALIDGRPYENAELSLVLSSSPKAYALERAAKAGIKTTVIDKENFSNRESFSKEIVKTLEKEQVDLVVLAGFMFILTEEFTEKFKAINIHPSLIPSFCGDGFYGLRVHKAALDYGVKITGATVHYVTAETDAGPIIAQKAIDILPDDTPESLQKRVMEECEWKLLVQAVRELTTPNEK